MLCDIILLQESGMPQTAEFYLNKYICMNMFERFKLKQHWKAGTTSPLPSRIRVKNWEKYHEIFRIIWNLEYAVGSPFIWHLSSFRHDLLGPAVLGQGGNGANTWQGSETSPVDWLHSVFFHRVTSCFMVGCFALESSHAFFWRVPSFFPRIAAPGKSKYRKMCGHLFYQEIASQSRN